MQLDFHYYATYCAAFLAGYSHEESLEICRSAQFVDDCSRTLLSRIHAPLAGATTQLQLELMDTKTDQIGLQDITRIWASFHFLPYDLHAKPQKGFRKYREKYQLICNPNGPLLTDTVNLAKGGGLEAAGIAMHVLADTWAHRYFAGTPSLVINNTEFHFYELISENGIETERQISFRHTMNKPDDPAISDYVNSLYYFSEKSIMNLGHARAGHLPDYSYIRYKYLPAWADYEAVIKDNPADYMNAFCQMVYALSFLHGDEPVFLPDRYAFETVAPWKDAIRSILEKRQTDACDDWNLFAQSLSGEMIPAYETDGWQAEYMAAEGEEEKAQTHLGRFLLSALEQKSMITNRIHAAGNHLAGISVDYNERGFHGIRDYKRLAGRHQQEARHE